ncbi:MULTISPECIES: lamin tail domain-containing protein [Streptomyces]|uniref:lamin tail domain-containing protein n=1 Tax=Streptomyces TaxID=1883 RepID=UPI0009979909|nr:MULTISPECIES: lamin tail domain-containing protein [Streptomyces]
MPGGGQHAALDPCLCPARARAGRGPQADSLGRDDGSNRSLNAEWVMVKNTGRYAVALTGWTLTSRRTHVTYRFHLRLGGHRQARVHTGRSLDTMRDVYQNRRTYAGDNYRDTAVLRNDHRLVVDTKHWNHR